MDQLKAELKRDTDRKKREEREKRRKEEEAQQKNNNGKKKNGKNDNKSKSQKGGKQSANNNQNKNKNNKNQNQQKNKGGKENNSKNDNKKKGNDNKSKSQQSKPSQPNKPQQPKVDKKMVKKFNKDCLGQNKPFEVNNDTERFITYGLSQKENILLREDENYEKIAVKLYEVLVSDKNVKNKNKSKIIDLDKVYNIIFNKTKLNEHQKTFLALNLEIVSQIETKKSCLVAVKMLDEGDILDKYFINIPKINAPKTMQEFDDYGLNYAYPLDKEIYENIEGIINNQGSLTDIIEFLTNLQQKQKCFTNYKTMKMILNYALNTVYFSKCVDNDDEKNEELAKQLLIAKRIKEKTELGRLIHLLHCKGEEKDDDDDEEDEDDEEEEEEDEEEDDEVDGHSVLIMSNIISTSSSLNNNNNGLLALLKTIEVANLIKFQAIRKFWHDGMNDKYTIDRLSAVSKLGDWYNELDARQARLQAERDNNATYEEEYDDSYAGNLYEKPKHKTAADYQAFSLID